jgi:hypothetical protein
MGLPTILGHTQLYGLQMLPSTPTKKSTYFPQKRLLLPSHPTALLYILGILPLSWAIILLLALLSACAHWEGSFLDS